MQSEYNENEPLLPHYSAWSTKHPRTRLKFLPLVVWAVVRGLMTPLLARGWQRIRNIKESLCMSASRTQDAPMLGGTTQRDFSMNRPPSPGDTLGVTPLLCAMSPMLQHTLLKMMQICQHFWVGILVLYKSHLNAVSSRICPWLPHKHSACVLILNWLIEACRGT